MVGTKECNSFTTVKIAFMQYLKVTYMSLLQCKNMMATKIGKIVESPSTMLIEDWFKNDELKWGLGG